MSESKKFDVVVIGAGPGGYVAAIRAAQNGRSVALIEKEALGGTCLHRGCIPKKALLASAEMLEKVRHAEEFGISVGAITFDYAKMNARKQAVVDKICASLGQLIATNHIQVFKGTGKFLSPTEIKVVGENSAILQADKVIIATGSEPRNMSAFPFDFEYVHSSTSIMALNKLPKRIAIIGGGYIGCELAGLYKTMDCDVSIIEAMPTILPMEAPSVVQALTRVYEKQKIALHTQAVVEKIEKVSGGIEVCLAGGKRIAADIALVAIGRELNTKGIGLEAAGVIVDSKGAIPVTDRMETNVPGIYAIGDITAKWMLAHVASHQGVVAANNACGVSCRLHYHAVPSVIFTTPEIASVGMSLEQAIKEGRNASVGQFPFTALGKAQAALETEGFAQIIIDKTTRQILGAQVVGHEASGIIGEMALAISNELTLDEVIETIHPHPTIAEVWLEAGMLAADMPIHLPPKRKKS